MDNKYSLSANITILTATATTITTTLPVSHSAAGDKSMVQVLRSRFVRAFVVVVMGPPADLWFFPIPAVGHTPCRRNEIVP